MKILSATCRLLSALITMSVITGCDTLPTKPSNNSITNDDPLTPHIVTKPLPLPSTDTAAEELHFPTDTLYSLLVAEVAASRRQYSTTIENYVAQAKNTGNKAIVMRAARIAQFLRADNEALEMGLLWLEQEPDNKEALTIVTNSYLELQQPTKALDYAEKLLQLTSNTSIADTPKTLDEQDVEQTATQHKNDTGALIETIANFSKQTDQATREILINRIEKLAIDYPNQTGIKVGLSTLYQSQGDNALAGVWIARALTQDPTRTSAIIQDIRLLQSTKQDSLAIEKLKRYVDESPDNPRLRLLYARLLTQSDIPEAYQQFTLLSEQAPEQLDLRFSRALLSLELEKADLAKGLFESLLSDNYQPDNVNYYLGHINDYQKNTDIALAYYLAVTQGDNFLPAQYRAAKIYLSTGHVDKAQTVFQQLHQQFPEKTEQLYEDEARLLVSNKIDDAALTLLNKAIALYPDNTSLRYERSTVYERQDQLELMENDFRHILAIEPDNAAALNGLGYFLTIRTERYEEAYQLIQQALTLEPEDAAIIDSMGWVLFKLDRKEEAIRYLRQAYQQYPNPEVAAHLGEALWANGEQDAAKQVWQESLQQYPEATDIPNTIKRLNISL